MLMFSVNDQNTVKYWWFCLVYGV